MPAGTAGRKGERQVVPAKTGTQGDRLEAGAPKEERQDAAPAKAGSGGPPDGWFTARQVAAFFDVVLAHAKRDYLPLAPPAGRQRCRAINGCPVIYHGRSLLEAWLADRIGKARVAAVGAGAAAGDGRTIEDELNSGSASPWLEEQRKQKALRYEMENEKMRGNLIPREEVHTLLAIVASFFRQAGETLQQQFGPASYAILEEAIAAAERELAHRLGPMDKREDEPTQPEQEADDLGVGHAVAHDS